MPRLVLARLAWLVLVVTGPLTAGAQTGSVAGRVSHILSATPLEGVSVRVSSATALAGSTTTGPGGEYRLGGLASGTYSLTFSRIGFRPLTVTGVRVAADMTTTENVDLTEVGLLLNPIVTTASRGVAEKYLDAPASISAITAEQIEGKPTALVTDYLATLPGVSIISGGLTQSNVVSRGFNNAFSTQMLGLQDYRYSGLPSLKGNLAFLYTAVNEDIDRIEVLNGPAAALYGPNAANGVMHIITKSPFSSDGSTISIDGGSRDIFRVAGRTSSVLGSKQQWGAKLSGEYFTGTDWEDRDQNLPAVFPSSAPPERAGNPIRRQTNNSRYVGEARLDYRSEGRLFENSLTAGQTKILHSNELTTTFGPTEGRNWTYTSVQNRTRYKRFFAQAFYNGSNSGNDSPTDPSGSFTLATGMPIVDNSRVMVGQVQQGFDLFRSTMIAGLDYIYTQPRSEGSLYGRYETTDDFGSTTITETGAYLHATIPIVHKLDFVGAIRGDKTSQLDGAQFSPRAALVFKPTASNSIRASFGRAFNSPIGFEYFLDQVVNPNLAPGFALRAIGNPSRRGWQFDRSCDATINAGLCMRSPWVVGGGATAVASTAAGAFPGFIVALPAIVNALPTLTASDKAALTGLLAQLNPILSPLRPTPAQVGTYLLNGAPVAAVDVRDLGPRRASFNNTWELGYKGIIKNKFRAAIDVWYQERGDVGVPISQANPLVMYEPTSLGAYLFTSIRDGLIAAGQSSAQATATAQAASAALVPLMAALPQGSLAFTSALNSDPSVIVTYSNGDGKLYVHGLDLALDYAPSETWSVGGTYSWQNKVAFPELGGPTNPLMSNTPKHRASGTARYKSLRGLGLESTIRYNDTFGVNSGYYNSLSPNSFNAAFATNEPVRAQIKVDAAASYRFRTTGFTAGLSVSNLLNNEVPNFAGTPAIGRLIIGRLKYDF